MVTESSRGFSRWFLVAGGLVFLLALVPHNWMTARQASSSATPIISRAVAFGVSLPVGDLPPTDPETDNVFTLPPAEEDGGPLPEPNQRVFPMRLFRLDTFYPGALSAAEQFSAPGNQDIPPSLAFEGLSNQDNFNTFGSRVAPPDTVGDVGPNHYVQATNVLFRVWDKNGNPLTPPSRLSGLFNPLGGACALSAKGDPIVLYDPFADRWLISQLGFASTPGVPPYYECIAVSQTPDPTGAYYLYAFQTPGNEFPDYPKLGVWPDAYYMTVNQFSSGGPFNGTGAFAFDRARMLLGDPSASYVYFNLSLTAYPERIGGMLPSDFDGLIAPPVGRPNIFAYMTSITFGNVSDALRLFDFHVDFGNPTNSTFTERPESPLPVAPFNPTSPTGRADILQPPPSTNTSALDSISDRLMYRLQYRNSPSGESLVMNHTVGAPASTVLGTYRAGVRYYQLKSSGGAYSIAEQATYAPSDGLSRWMGNAATDHEGNLAVAFSTSSINQFPSLAYAGRLASDPPGGLFHGEQTLVAGTGVQTGSTRWGDYSSLNVDPLDDCTFWFTSEYYSAASQAGSPVGWLTRIGRFKFDQCSTPARGTLQGLVSDAATGAPVSGATVQLSNGFSALSIANGTYLAALTRGIYNVTVSRLGYVPVTLSNVSISNGSATTLNVVLSGTPAIAAGSAIVTAESFAPFNGGIDPGESVTVSFTVRNIGAGSTADLSATLLSTGGVLSPDGPQNFGAISPGGSSIRAFTFRADPSLSCGGKLTASLHVQDGSNDLGIVRFDFLLAGNTITVMAENFDGVTPPALPAGWVASNGDGSTVFWTTISIGNIDTPPNGAFVAAPAVVSDKRLDSVPFLVRSAAAQLSFRHANTLQPGLDGGVLEISIDGGPFVDFLLAGGTFALNGYTTLMTAGSGNPLAGRPAWSGTNPLRTTIANLPASAQGKMVKVQWRMGSNSTTASAGWTVDTVTVTEVVSLCNFNIAGAGSAITAESFAPTNGAIDAGEIVTVNLTLRNSGTTPTTSLNATLLPTGGVLEPSAPQAYGVIAGGGGTVTRSFHFRADPQLGCAGTLTATLYLQDGLTDLGIATFKLQLAGSVITIFSEDFDGVIAPALPAGWVATVATGAVPWLTTATIPDTLPNDALASGVATVLDTRLDSPAFVFQTSGAQLSFRHFNILQPGFDGGVLEISVAGGAFVDILAAGGSFALNGYDVAITAATNPLVGRMAWSSTQSGYRTTIVNLPTAAAGKQVKLRWRMATDSTVGSPGWRVDTVKVSEIQAQCIYNLLPFTASITSESFAPANGAIDPGEKVTVDFGLRNAGIQGTSSLLSALQSSGGVTDPGSPALYGVIAANGGVGTRPLTFRADSNLKCGDPLVATHQMSEGAVDLGSAKFDFTLGSLQTPLRLSENFDGVSAPALPAGWTASNPLGSAPLWGTTLFTPDTPPNAAFIDDPAGISDKRLDSPAFAVQSDAAQLTFRNNYSLDPFFDGGVLEISVNGGPFTDILAAGGGFLQGGYNGSVTVGELNPLDGRRVWTGSSNGYTTTTVNLPPTAAGSMVQLRWRMGSGLTAGGPGWRIDGITVIDRIRTCSTRAVTTTLVTASSNPSTYGDTVQLSATVRPVTPGLGIPDGEVLFKEAGGVLATVPLDGSGVASFETSALRAGTHTITAFYVGALDYQPSNGSILQSVNRKTAVWTTDAGGKVYAGPDTDPVTGGSGTGFLVSDGISALYSREAGETVGVYHVTATLSPADRVLNYDVTNEGASFVISPAAISVHADSTSRNYGSPNPLFTGTLSGILNSDKITATYGTTATPTSPVGSYAITPILHDPEGKLSNYSVSSTNGTLFVGFTYGVYSTDTSCAAVQLSDFARIDGDLAAVGGTKLAGQSTINGALFSTNPTVGDCRQGNGITLTGKAGVTGGYLPLVPLPFLSPVTAAPGVEDVQVTNGDRTLPPGDYRNIQISGRSTLRLLAGSYRVNSLRLVGGAELVVPSEGLVTLEVEGSGTPVDIRGGRISNPAGNSHSFLLIYPGAGDLELSGSSNGLVYAPNAGIRLSGQAEWFGAVVVRSLELRGGSSIRYDRRLQLP